MATGGYPQVPGPTGPQGPQGIQGIQGVQGPPGATRRIFSARGVTDAAGNVTLNFGTAFAATPVVSVSFQGAASADPVDYRITALSTTSVTLHVRRSPATTIALLGLTLLGASVPLAGATMHVIAAEVGNT